MRALEEDRSTLYLQAAPGPVSWYVGCSSDLPAVWCSPWAWLRISAPNCTHSDIFPVPSSPAAGLRMMLAAVLWARWWCGALWKCYKLISCCFIVIITVLNYMLFDQQSLISPTFSARPVSCTLARRHAAPSCRVMLCHAARASNEDSRRLREDFTITEKAHNRAFLWLKPPTSFQIC